MNLVKGPDGSLYQVNPDGSYTLVQPVGSGNTPPMGLQSIAPAMQSSLVNYGVNSLLGSGGGAAVPATTGIPVASSMNGGILTTTSPEVIPGAGAQAAGSTLSTSLGALAAIHGGYNLVNNWGHLGGVKGGAMTGMETGAGIGTMILPGAGTAIGAGLGALAGGIAGKFDHKTTKQYEQERLQALMAKGDDKWKAQVAGLAQAAHPPGDKGEKWTPEVAAAAMKDPVSMWGTNGMLSAFGPDYFNKMNEFQRYAASQYAIDNGLLKGDHGDIIVTDPDKLKNALKEFTANKKYLEAYNKWKKANPKEKGIPGVKSPDSTTSTPSSGKGIDLSSLIPKSDGRAEKQARINDILSNSRQEQYKPINIGSSLKGLMPSKYNY